MTTCSDVMTRELVYCEPGDPVTKAADLMRQHEVGSLPVVESPGSTRLLGIVTDRDLIVKIVVGSQAAASARVRDAMVSDALSCREDEDLRRALTLMAEHEVSRMPVVDKTGRLVGMVGLADVRDACADGSGSQRRFQA
jgi:CBS domain-containing protein